MTISHFARYFVPVDDNVVESWPGLPSRSSLLASQVWAESKIRGRMLELMSLAELIVMAKINQSTFIEAIKELWRVVEPMKYLELAQLGCSEAREQLYNAAIAIVDLRSMSRSYKKFDDVSSWITTFPSAYLILTDFATIKRIGHTQDGSPIIQVILERNREIPGLEVQPWDTLDPIAQQFPQHWQVDIGFKLGIIDRAFQAPLWAGKTKSKSKPKVPELDLVDAFSNLKGNLEAYIPNLTVWAPISLETIAAYHQKKLATWAVPTRRYTIYTHDYKIEDLKQFALSTMGSIDMLDLRLHVNYEAEITMEQLLTEFDWTFFYGIKEVDITVMAPHPDPDRPYEEFKSVFSGHALNLKSFTLRFHWLMEAHDGLVFPTIRMLDLASALLPIGGPLCEYSIAFTESQDRIVDQKKNEKREAAEGWLTASLRKEIEKLNDIRAEHYQSKGWARVGTGEINMWGQAVPYGEYQGIDWRM